MNKKIAAALCVLFIIICTDCFGCNRQSEQKINESQPQELYKAIIQKQFDVLKKKFGTQEFTEQVNNFVQYLQCIRSALKLQNKGNNEAATAIAKISGNANRLAEIVAENKAWELRDSLYFIKDELDTYYWTYLYKIDKEIDDVPVAWKNSIPSKPSLILPNYELFFKHYVEVKKAHNKSKNLPSETILPFFRIEQFLKTQLPPMKDTKVELIRFANTLEKLIYRLQEDKKKSWFGLGNAKLQSYIDLSSEIMAGIFEKYPGFITSKVDQKVRMSNNKVYLAIVASSVSLYNIVVYILDSLKKQGAR